jgi:hypothetical protein
LLFLLAQAGLPEAESFARRHAGVALERIQGAGHFSFTDYVYLRQPFASWYDCAYDAGHLVARRIINSICLFLKTHYRIALETN